MLNGKQPILPIKRPSDSLTMMTEMVMPNDTNPLDNLMGGNLLRLMDVTGAICARRHANRICVTASVDSVSFDSPIKLGEIVSITAKVTRVFRTSMEMRIKVHAETPDARSKRKCNEAFMTFVGINEEGRPVPLPQLEPETEEEWMDHELAMRRREMRLIIAGKMRPSDSKELKAMFKG